MDPERACIRRCRCCEEGLPELRGVPPDLEERGVRVARGVTTAEPEELPGLTRLLGIELGIRGLGLATARGGTTPAIAK